jgi:hypothetical protein
MYACRECERELNQATEVCPYCGTDLSEGATVASAPVRKPKLVMMIARFGILLAAIWGFLWFVLPEHKGGQAAAQAEDKAIKALRDANAALSAYAAAQNGSFPPALEALSGAGGEQVRQSAQAALSEGYHLEYNLRTSDAGSQQHYSLLARPRNYGYREFYTDETGVLRATRENRPANAQDPAN